MDLSILVREVPGVIASVCVGLTLAYASHCWTKRRDLATWRQEARKFTAQLEVERTRREEDAERYRRETLFTARSTAHARLLELAWHCEDAAHRHCRQLWLTRQEHKKATDQHAEPFNELWPKLEIAMWSVRLHAEDGTRNRAEDLRNTLFRWYSEVDKIDQDYPSTATGDLSIRDQHNKSLEAIHAFEAAARQDVGSNPLRGS